MARFDDRIAVVTGAANGIGRATASRLADEGARVALLDIQREALEELAADIGDRALPIQADVLSAKERLRAMQAITDTMGTPDVLVNCVGGSTVLDRADLPLEAMSEEQWEQMIRFNVSSTFLCCKDFIPGLRRSPGAAIVNLGSISGRWSTMQSGVAYAAAKAAITGMTRRLSAELAPFGIRCNAVAPGFVMTQRIRERVWGAASESQRSRLLAQIPLGRLAKPDEVAAAIAFLASADASYITGITLDCNGGMVSY